MAWKSYWNKICFQSSSLWVRLALSHAFCRVWRQNVVRIWMSNQKWENSVDLSNGRPGRTSSGLYITGLPKTIVLSSLCFLARDVDLYAFLWAKIFCWLLLTVFSFLILANHLQVKEGNRKIKTHCTFIFPNFFKIWKSTTSGTSVFWNRVKTAVKSVTRVSPNRH